MPKEVRTNPYDFLNLFDGLNETQIKARMKRILALLAEEEEKEKNEMTIQDDLAKMGGMVGPGWLAPQPEPPAAPPPFDPSAASQSVTALQQEYSQLMRNPSRNMARMKQIQTEIAQLGGQLQQHNQTVRQENALQAAPELGALETDIASLTDEYSSLIREPSKNHARLKEIQGELSKRTQRRTALLNGAPTSNEWKG